MQPALQYPRAPAPEVAPAHHEGFKLPRDERMSQSDSLPIVGGGMSGRTKAIIAGCAGLAVIVIIFLATRGSNETKPEQPVIAKIDPPATPSSGEAPPVPVPNIDDNSTGSATETPPDSTGSGSAVVTTPVDRTPIGTTPTGRTPTGTNPTGTTPTATTPTGTTPTGTTPTGPRGPKGPKGPRTIGKTGPEPGETGPAIKSPNTENQAKARSAYEAGNSKLFSGDYDGAIAEYKQVVAFGSASGHRGLGLAYAQRGDKAKALQSFRSYLGAAPNAKDADAIRKRIAALSAQ